MKTKFVVWVHKMKKAQSISINTIVVAAIALIVLVVIIAIFGGQIRDFLAGTQSCASRGGKCYDGSCGEYANSVGGGVYTNLPGTNCEDIGGSYSCCIPLINPLS